MNIIFCLECTDPRNQKVGFSLYIASRSLIQYKDDILPV